MIFRLYGQTFVSRVARRSLGHSPGFQCAIDFQTKVIVQTARRMLLYNESIFAGELRRLASGLGRSVEATLALVFLKLGHGRILSQAVGWP